MNARIAALREKAVQRAAPAISWYQSRQPREQRVLQALLATVIVLLLISALWMPAWNVRAREISNWERQGKLLAWIQGNAAMIRQQKQAAPGNSAAPAGNWIAGLSKSAASANVVLKGFNPDGDNSVRIQLENQPFSASFLWLQQLSSQGIQVSSAEILPGAAPGRINLRATLRQAL